jgi:hypothetical protein
MLVGHPRLTVGERHPGRLPARDLGELPHLRDL